jgi:hypothetical protein
MLPTTPHPGAWHRFDSYRKLTEVSVSRTSYQCGRLSIPTVLCLLLIKVNCIVFLGKTRTFLPLEIMRFYLLLFDVSPYTELALSVEPLQMAIHKWLPKQIQAIFRSMLDGNCHPPLRQTPE